MIQLMTLIKSELKYCQTLIQSQVAFTNLYSIYSANTKTVQAANGMVATTNEKLPKTQSHPLFAMVMVGQILIWFCRYNHCRGNFANKLLTSNNIGNFIEKICLKFLSLFLRDLQITCVKDCTTDLVIKTYQF